MPKWNVLVVDDDPAVCQVIKDLLIGESYSVDTAYDAAYAWEKLKQPGNIYSLVILDRKMPGIDGLELLRMIKSDSHLTDLPVIIQSGATSPEEIAEGIEFGAYYYLTKPYEPKTLFCIVRTVINDIEFRSNVAAKAAQHFNSLNYITRMELCLTTLEDVDHVAGFLGSLCPNPDQASYCLMELLLNAVEHGNLGIGYDEKKQLLLENCWETEINRRLTLPEYKDRTAVVTFERRKDFLEFRHNRSGKRI